VPPFLWLKFHFNPEGNLFHRKLVSIYQIIEWCYRSEDDNINFSHRENPKSYIEACFAVGRPPVRVVLADFSAVKKISV
jgi:hypothetical protein